MVCTVHRDGGDRLIARADTAAYRVLMTVFFLSFVYVAMNAILHEFMMSSFSMSRWLDEESPNAIRSRCVGFGLKEPPQLFF